MVKRYRQEKTLSENNLTGLKNMVYNATSF